MKKKIIIFISFIILSSVFVVIYKSFDKKSVEAVLPDKIVEINGNKEFQSPDWGPKSIICKRGGFDILAYAGQKVMIEHSSGIGKYYNRTPLDKYTIDANGKVICEYYADSAGSMAPGVFAINDPNITSK